MVTEPGKASRILQMPESKQEAPKQEATEQAQKEEPKEAPKEAVVEAPAEAPKVENEPAVEMAEKPAPTPAATPTPVAVEEAKKHETQIASLEQQPKEQPTPEQPATEPEAKVEEKPMAIAEIAEQPKPATKPIIKVEEPQQTAKVEEPAKPQVPVLIQAAEVEGEKIFIAGTGLSGTNVHIYIDGIFLGKTEVGAEGSYVFEGIGGLDAGRHAVRADMMSDNSTEVIARAVVSLLHEPVIIDPVKVAKVEPKPEMAEPAKDMAKMVEEKAPETMTKTVVVKKAEIASETTEPVVEKEMAAVAPKPAPAKMSPPSKQPKQEPMKVAAVEEKVEMSPSSELAVTPKKMEMIKPAAQMEKPAVEIASDTTASIAEITTGSSVIIRKGDSLWRVSQRRYGEGVRYTTIFDANRDQIRDPDLIYPGQVFEIPTFKEKS
ncbi:MAG: LysM peptidoglycan-binding domain-containing protein [Rhizobiaceae bacterium]|nr:LysM peptidoglycan-binding domain-containing protein [Rhizobiaceae bacterium]